MKTLLLIDSHSLIHRCFHALPPLTTPEGKPIQAIYGLSSVFLRLWREGKPDYAAALFDRPEPTFRKQQYKEYKAQRPQAPDALISQLIEARNFFTQFGIKTFEAPGYEADDLIATFAEKFRGEKDVRIVILTGDLDTLQLTEGDKVVVRTFRKGISDTFIYNENAVMERYGLRPNQMPDYKALVGDASDNIKGVPGVGPKTASELLKKYDSLENIFAHLANEPKFAKKAEDFKTQAEFSKSLVVLNLMAPVTLDKLDELAVRDSTEKLASYFKKLGFDSLLKRLENNTAPVPKESAPPNLQGTQDLFSERFSEKGEEIFLPPSVFGSSEFSSEHSSTRLKVGFHIKALMKKFHAEGHVLSPPYFDLGVAFWLLDPDLKNYEPAFIAQKFLKREWQGGEADLRALFSLVRPKLQNYELTKTFKEIEMPLLEVLAEVEEAGIAIDLHVLGKMRATIEKNLSDLTRAIYGETGEEFNINSPKQLGKILSDRLSREGAKPAKRTPGGQFSTSAENLEGYAAELPVAKRILEYRDGFKILSTYVKPFEQLVGDDGRLHTEFIQTGAATGRLSSREPNLQNIPQESVWAKELRSAFIASPGMSLLALDYSQIELRILASLSGDEEMLGAFRKNLDIHRATAAKVFRVQIENVTPEMRRLAKTLNFGLIYGMGASAFAKTSGLTRNEASEFISAYFKEFSRVRTWQENVKSEARTFGYVQTLTGRRRYLSDIASGSPRFVSAAERAAINQPIQGFAADIIKLAMIRARQALLEKHWWGKEIKMILSIHDELLFEVHDSIIKEAIPLITASMESVYDLGIPLRVEVALGKNWGAMQKQKRDT